MISSVKKGLLLLFFSWSLGSYGRSAVDSLEKVLAGVHTDSVRTTLLNELSKQLWQTGEYDKALRYANEAILLSRKTGQKREEVLGLNNSATVYRHRSVNDTALELYTQMLQLASAIRYKDGEAMAYGNIGLVYLSLSDYPRSLENLFRALAIAEAAGDKKRIGLQYGNIGLVYKDQGDYKKALDYYGRALSLAKEVNDPGAVARNYGNIASILSDQALAGGITMHVHDSLLMTAMQYHLNSLAIKKKLGNKNGIAISLDHIAGIYSDMGDYLRALEYYGQALRLAKEMGDRSFVGNCLGNIGYVHWKMKHFKEAEEHLLEGVSLGNATRDLDAVKDWYADLSNLYAETGRDREAFEYYRKYIGLRDSIFSEANTKKTVQAQMQYEFEKKEAASKAEQEKKDAVAAADARRQRIILFSVAGCLLLVAVFAVFIFRSYREKQQANIEIMRQKQLIEEKQKEILDSIYYARRIQRSLLPSEKYMERGMNRK